MEQIALDIVFYFFIALGLFFLGMGCGDFKRAGRRSLSPERTELRVNATIYIALAGALFSMALIIKHIGHDCI